MLTPMVGQVLYVCVCCVWPLKGVTGWNVLVEGEKLWSLFPPDCGRDHLPWSHFSLADPGGGVSSLIGCGSDVGSDEVVTGTDCRPTPGILASTSLRVMSLRWTSTGTPPANEI